MNLFKNFILLFLLALISCTVPQTNTVTRQAMVFDYMNLTQEMLSDTTWCGPLTTSLAVNVTDKYMAVCFKNGKGGIGRGRTPEDAIRAALQKLTKVNLCQIIASEQKVCILNFWDGGKLLGRVNADIIYTSNHQAQIRIYNDVAPNSAVAYEAQKALKTNI